jgi:RNA polymerase sigma-70 factor (ECF subfamily)
LRRPIAAAVIRTARQFGPVSPELADDLMQDTFVRLCADDCRALRELRSVEPGAAYALAQAAAVTITLDHFRALSTHKRGRGRKIVALDQSPMLQLPDRTQESRLEHSLLVQQIDRHLPDLAMEGNVERDRRIFWLYYRHGFTPKDIARVPSLGLSAKGVESAIYRLTTGLKKLFSPAAQPQKENPPE